jgi:hypothetical protein
MNPQMRGDNLIQEGQRGGGSGASISTASWVNGRPRPTAWALSIARSRVDEISTSQASAKSSRCCGGLCPGNRPMSS